MARPPKAAPKPALALVRNDPPAKQAPPPEQRLVRNNTRGTQLHLGDGRRLEYGEEALVPK